jgi:hypothetical protein
MSAQLQGGSPINLTASGAVSLVPGQLLGFYVNTATAGTIVIRDGGSGGTAVNGTITTSTPGWNAFPCQFSTSCYATLGGTINVTFFFQPG